MLRLEASGQVLRGRFLPSSALSPQSSGLSGADSTEWCHRRLLARIHRLTIGILRKEVEPVTASDFMRFLMQWQHVVPGSRQHGEAGLLQVIGQLAGYEAAASAWEPHLLRTRMAKYEPALLDRLCLSGAVVWGRLSPHPKFSQAGETDRRRIVPTSLAPISLFLREDSEWLMNVVRGETTTATADPSSQLSTIAQDLCRALRQQGASFFADLVRMTNRLPTEIENGLWELVAAGLVTADGFDNLRALMDPHRRRAEGRERTRRPRHAAGRWSLLRSVNQSRVNGQGSSGSDQAVSPSALTQHSTLSTQHCERTARLLLRRYGVVFRDVLARESLIQSWRDLLVQYRRMEMAGEVRGGRFVNGFTGEQFALPEAVEALRTIRKKNASAGTEHEIKLSATDPLNLAGVILPGLRVPAVPTNFLVFKDGILSRTVIGRQGDSAPAAAQHTSQVTVRKPA